MRVHAGADDVRAGDVNDRRGARPWSRRPERRQLRVPSAEDVLGGQRLLLGFDRVDDDAVRRSADARQTADEAFGVSLEGAA